MIGGLGVDLYNLFRGKGEKTAEFEAARKRVTPSPKSAPPGSERAQRLNAPTSSTWVDQRNWPTGLTQSRR